MSKTTTILNLTLAGALTATLVTGAAQHRPAAAESSATSTHTTREDVATTAAATATTASTQGITGKPSSTRASRILVPVTRATTSPRDTPATKSTRTVNVLKDAAWTVYMDPKAISTSKATYFATVNSQGSTALTSIAKSDSRIETRTISYRYARDDHAAPALLATKNGRIAAFHSSHGHKPLRYAVTDTSGKLSTISPSRTLRGSGIENRGATYAQVMHLPNATYKYYVFTRLDDNRWYMTRSTDLARWTKAVPVAKDPYKSSPKALAGDAHEYPYVEASADSPRNRIHLAISTGYDTTGKNNRAYHFVLKGTKLTNSTGKVVHDYAGSRGRSTPVDPRKGTLITPAEGRSQLFDIATTPGGDPVVLTQHGSYSNFRRNYSTFDGRSFTTVSLTRDADRGRSMALDQQDPRTLYLVRKTAAGPNHLEEWTLTADRSWSVRSIQAGNGKENWTPVTAKDGRYKQDSLFWMRGVKPSFNNYRTSVVMETSGRAPVTVGSTSSRSGKVTITTDEGIGGRRAARVPVTLRHHGKVVAAGTTNRNGALTLTPRGVKRGSKVMVSIPASSSWGAATGYVTLR